MTSMYKKKTNMNTRNSITKRPLCRWGRTEPPFGCCCNRHSQHSVAAAADDDDDDTYTDSDDYDDAAHSCHRLNSHPTDTS